MRAFLTGATGFIGGHVARALLARGDRVRALVRAGRAGALPAGVEPFEGDLHDRARLRAGIDGSDVVYHCAGDYRLDARRPEELYRTNVEGAGKLLGAAADARVPRIVHTSSVGALGTNPDGTPADEETPVALDDVVGHYERSKFLGERVAREFAREGLGVVIVNPATVIGDGDTRPTPTGQIVLDFLNGRMPAYVDTGLNLVDVRDVAAGHLLAAERGRPGERYILGHRNMSLRALLEALAALCGRAAPRVRLPAWVPVAVAALEAPWARALGRPPRVSLDGARMARRRMFFDPDKAVRELGLPQSPIDAALARAVAWFRAQP